MGPGKPFSPRGNGWQSCCQSWGRVPDLSEAIAKIDAVNVPGVRAHAESLLVGGNGAMALYGPVAAAPDLSALQARLAA